MKDEILNCRGEEYHVYDAIQNFRPDFGELVWTHNRRYTTPLKMYLPHEVDIVREGNFILTYRKGTN